MRILGTGAIGLSVILGACACAAVNCSTTSEEPYDAGTLPDAFFGGEDSGAVVAPSVTDAGDATVVGPGADGSARDDAGDGAAPHHDAGADALVGTDAADGSLHDQDAADGSRGDANDASDASDATRGDDAGSAASVDSGNPSTDAPAVDAGGDDATDSAPPFDAAALCATFDPSSDPLRGVAAFDGTQLIEEDSTSGSVAGTGAATYGDPVTVTVWTLPPGIMQDVFVAYTADGFVTTTPLPLTSTGTTSAGPLGGSSPEAWTGTIPAQPHGTTVTWYAHGADACGGSEHYFSNNSANYQYSTP